MNSTVLIYIYETCRDKEPFNIWFNSLDQTTKVIIDARIERIKIGNFGDCEPLKAGIWEFKINYGPGYRIYFGKISNNQIILLLNEGDKNHQTKDIKKSKRVLG